MSSWCFDVVGCDQLFDIVQMSDWYVHCAMHLLLYAFAAKKHRFIVLIWADFLSLVVKIFTLCAWLLVLPVVFVSENRIRYRRIVHS